MPRDNRRSRYNKRWAQKTRLGHFFTAPVKPGQEQWSIWGAETSETWTGTMEGVHSSEKQGILGAPDSKQIEENSVLPMGF